MIFVNSKLGAARLARSFERDGLKTAALHGDKSQDERLKALDAFKRGDVQLLVATDVAARGLDIVDLPAVFNFDVPFNAEDYVHRIGRTGRAGPSGLSVTLVTRDDTRLVSDIERLIKKKIEIEPFELEDDRPRRPPRRVRDDDERPAERWPNRPSASSAAGRRRRPADPLFDQPYQPSGSVPRVGRCRHRRRPRAPCRRTSRPSARSPHCSAAAAPDAGRAADACGRCAAQAACNKKTAGSLSDWTAPRRHCTRCVRHQPSGQVSAQPMLRRVAGDRCSTSARSRAGLR